MTHLTLLKNGYRVVFETSKMKAYQCENVMIVLWSSGSYNVYRIE